MANAHLKIEEVLGGFSMSNAGMKMQKWVLAAVLALCAAGTAQSKAIECTTSSSDWVNSPYIFGYEGNSTAATVYDPVIHTFVGEPIGAKVEASAKKVVFKWSVLVEVRGDQTNMTYRASYFPADGKFIVRATPGAGYVDNFEGRGTCVVKEQ